MKHEITYHPEKEFGYQWVLLVEDKFGHMIMCFKTKKQAEEYVIFSILIHGEII